ncbi:tetratricopeptide repeat protein [Pedobacter sp. LMG 31643]|nr:tetratricopeptide repeat protein [Pedobacter foliorum]
MHNRLKHLFYSFLLLVISPLFLFAKGNPEELFAKGNSQYAKAQYKEAVQSYQEVLNTGYKSAAVYFNLGNAYYKLGEMAPAILNYEKAYKITPGDQEIQLNLQLANLKIADKIEVVPEFFMAKWWKSLVLFFSAQVLSIFAVTFFLLGFALLIVYLFAISVSIKKPAFYAGIALLVLGLLSIFIVNAQSNYLNSSSQAIVFNGTVNVKSGPDDKSKTLFVIHEGTKVTIKQNDDNWLKVELPNGNIGWIESVAIKEI